MNKKKFSEAMGEIDSKYVEKAMNYQAKKKKNSWFKWGAMVACLCLVLVGIAIPMLNNETSTPQEEKLARTYEGPANANSQDYVEILEFNGAEYVVCGKGETDILQECGISSELSQDLAGDHVCYLGFSSYRYFPVEKAGSEEENDIELFEYAPEPNENVYILCRAGEYYAAIRKDMLYGSYEDTDAIQTESQNETVDVSEVETEERVSPGPESPEEEFVWFIGPNNNTDFEYAYGEYDYVFYLESISLSSDGQPGQIYINPVEFVWNWETQRWLDWGNSEDEGPYCDVRDEDPDDTLILPIKQTTEFHFYNGMDDSTLYELSDRYKGRECVTTDPKVFLLYIHQQFTDDAEDYPFFLLLDQEGAVQYIIDAGLV